MVYSKEFLDELYEILSVFCEEGSIYTCLKGEDLVEYTRNCNDLDWIEISEMSYLSEEFMEVFKDKISWYIVSADQVMSDEFVERNYDKVVPCQLRRNNSVSIDMLMKIENGEAALAYVKRNNPSTFKKILEDLVPELSLLDE